MLDQVGLTQATPLSLSTLVINLILGALLASAISWHYIRFGRTYTNRGELAWVFPLIALATVLVISVVKSSLALSLGLVGALSIVRFRTPIKEPEELAYLFLTIAVGLGLGAEQRTATVVAFGLILGIMTARSLLGGKPDRSSLYMNVEVPRHQSNGDQAVARINGVLAKHARAADMRRLDARNGTLEATYLIECVDPESLLELLDGLDSSLPGIQVSFVEQKGIPGR